MATKGIDTQATAEKMYSDLLKTGQNVVNDIIKKLGAKDAKVLSAQQKEAKKGSQEYKNIEVKLTQLEEALKNPSISTKLLVTKDSKSMASQINSEWKSIKQQLNQTEIGTTQLNKITQQIENLAKKYGYKNPEKGQTTQQKFYTDAIEVTSTKAMQSFGEAVVNLGTAIGDYKKKQYDNQPLLSTNIKSEGIAKDIKKRVETQLAQVDINGKTTETELNILKNNRQGYYISPLNLQFIDDISKKLNQIVYYDTETIGQIGSDNLRTTQISLRSGDGKKAIDGFIKLSAEARRRLQKNLERVQKGEILNEDENRELLSFANIIRDENKKIVTTSKKYSNFSENFRLASRDKELIADIVNGIEVLSSNIEKSGLRNLYSSEASAITNMTNTSKNKNAVAIGEDTYVVGQNNIRFDNRNLKDKGVSFVNTFDTLGFFRQYLSLGSTRIGQIEENKGKELVLSGYGLDDLARFFEVKLDESLRHTAGYDTELNRVIFEKALEYIKKDLDSDAAKKLAQDRIAIIERGQIAKAQTSYNRANRDSFKLEGGTTLPQLMKNKEVNNFYNRLFSKGSTYQYNGNTEAENGQLRAKFTDIVSGDEIFLIGTQEEIQATLSQVFRDGFTDYDKNNQNENQKLVQDLVASWFKVGNNGFLNAERVFNGVGQAAKNKQTFLKDNNEPLYNLLKEMQAQIKQTYSGTSQTDMRKRQVAWESLAKVAGIKEEQFANPTSLNNKILSSVTKKSFSALQEAYSEYIKASHLPDTVKQMLQDQLKNHAVTVRGDTNDNKIKDGDNPFYKFGMLLFEELSKDANALKEDLSQLTNPSEISKDLPTTQQDIKNWVKNNLQTIVSSNNGYNPNNVIKGLDSDKLNLTDEQRAYKKSAFTGAYLREKLQSYNYYSKEDLDKLTNNASGGIQNVQNILEEISREAGKLGLNTEIALDSNGDIRIGFYDSGLYTEVRDKNNNILWDKIANTTISLVDANGNINVNGMAKTNLNILRADEDGNAYMITSMEQQAIEIRDAIKKYSFSDLLRNTGEITEATRRLNQAKLKAFQVTPSSFTGKISPFSDIEKSSKAGTSVESRITKGSAVLLEKYLQDIYNIARKQQGSTLPEEITHEYYKAMLQIIGLINAGPEQMALAKQTDKMIELQAYDVINEKLADLAKTLKISYQGMQEGQVPSGYMFNQMSSEDLEFLGGFKEGAQRSTTQGYNKLELLVNETARAIGDAKNKAIARQNNFGHVLLNKDDATRSTFRVGYINDDIIKEIWDTLKVEFKNEGNTEAVKYLEKTLIPSVTEDANIIFDKVIPALQAYRLDSYHFNPDQVNEAFIKALGPDFIENTVKEFIVKQDRVIGTRNGKKVTVHKGDIVSAALSNGTYSFDVKRFSDVYTGTKLVGDGFRTTVGTIIETEGKSIKAQIGRKFQEQLNNRGYKDTQFLVTDNNISSRNLDNLYRTRLQYIINEYIDRRKEQVGNSKTVDDIRGEVVDLIHNNPNFVDAFKKLFNFVNGVIYEGKLTKEEEKSLIEDNPAFSNIFASDSYMNQIGKMLFENLEAKKTDNTRNYTKEWAEIQANKLADAMLNIAGNNYSYQEAIGDVDAEERENLHRVKLGIKELQALQRVFGVVKAQGDTISYKNGETNIEKSSAEIASAMSNMLNNFRTRQSSNRKGMMSEAQKYAEDVLLNLGGILEQRDKDFIVGASETQTGINATVNDIYNKIAGYDTKGGVSKTNYENSPLGILNEMFAKGNFERIILDLGQDIVVERETGKDGTFSRINNVIIPLLKERKLGEDTYVVDEVNKALQQLLGVISQKGYINDARYGVKVQDAVNEYLNTLYDLFTDKDSNYVQAFQITPPNAVVGKATSFNTAETQNKDWLENTIMVSKGQFKEMLLSSGLENDKDENIQTERLAQLQQLLAIGEQLELNLDTKKTFAQEKLEQYKKSYNTFRKKELQIINSITEAITYRGQIKQEEAKFLTAFYHRYPSINGLDEVATKLMVDPSLKGAEAIKVAQGLAKQTKTDFDGDTVRAMLGLGGRSQGKFDKDEFLMVEAGKVQLREIMDEVAKDVSASMNLKSKGLEYNTAGLSEADLNKMIATIQSSKLVGLMSQINKENIGSLSNISTGLRGLQYNAGIDERTLDAGVVARVNTALKNKENVNAKDEQQVRDAIYTALYRGLLEQFEQDSISSKKISARLGQKIKKDEQATGQKYTEEQIETLILDEINKFTDTLKSGDWKSIFQQATRIGILSEEEGLNTERSRSIANFIARSYGAVGEQILKELGMTKTSVAYGQGTRDIYTGISTQALSKVTSYVDNRLKEKGYKPFYDRYDPSSNFNAHTSNSTAKNYYKALDIVRNGMQVLTVDDSGVTKRGLNTSEFEYYLKQVQDLQTRHKEGQSTEAIELAQQRLKEYILNNKHGAVDFANEYFGKNFTNEEDAINALNKALGIEHVEAVEKAEKAELAKVEASKAVVKALGLEGEALDNVSGKAEAHAKTFSQFNQVFKKSTTDIGLGALELTQDANTQGFIDKQGNQVLSVTRLIKELTMSSMNANQEKEQELLGTLYNKRIANGQIGSLTYQDIVNAGRTDVFKTEKDFIEAQNYYSATKVGDLSHLFYEILQKNFARNKADNAAYLAQNPERINEIIRNATSSGGEFYGRYKELEQEFNKLGLEIQDTTALSNIEAMVKAVHGLGQEFSGFAEEVLGLEFTIGKGKDARKYAIGTKLDTINTIRDEQGNIVGLRVNDLKTNSGGAVSAMARVQASIEAYALDTILRNELKGADLRKRLGLKTDLKGKDLQDYIDSLGITKDISIGHMNNKGEAQALFAKILSEKDIASLIAYLEEYVLKGIGQLLDPTEINKITKGGMPTIGEGENWYQSRLAQEETAFKDYYKQRDLLNQLQIEQLKLQKSLQTNEKNGNTAGIEKDTEALKKLEEELTKAKEGYEQLHQQVENAGYLEKWKTGDKAEQLRTQELNNNAELEKAQNQLDKASNKNSSNSALNAQMREYLNLQKELQRTEQDIYRTQVQMKSAKGDDLENVKKYNVMLQQRKNDLTQMLPSYADQVKKLRDMNASEDQIAQYTQKRNNLITQGNLQMAKLTASYKAQVPLADKIFNSLKQALSYMSLTSMISRSIWKVQNLIRTTINYAKELNSAMVDIQIAATMGLPEAQENMIQLNALAKQMGMTTSEMASAQNDWLRAGYRGQEVMELTKASATLATLGMIESSDATSYLISSLKGWKLEASEVMDVVSKLTAVDSAAAISAGDLAEAMSRANNSAQMAGIEMNRYIGLLTVGADITQRAPESIGQAWNTLIARMGNVKAGKFAASQTEQDSEDYDEANYEALNDVEKVLDSVGIKLRENFDTWKDTQDVIEEIANRWKDWDQTTQNAVATAVAGTRQREIFAATMNNYDQVAKYENIAANSYGTAQTKMEAYSDSIEAAQKRYQAAIENFALTLDRWGVIKDFYNALAFAVNNIKSLTAVLSILLVMVKGKEIANAFSNGVIGMGIKISNLGIGNLSSINNMNNEVVNPGLWQSFKDNITNNYVQQMQQAYGNALMNATTSLDEVTRQNYINFQNGIMLASTEEQELALQLLDNNLDKDTIVEKINILAQTKTGTALLEMYNSLMPQHIKAIQEEIMKENESITADELVAETARRLAAKRQQLITATGNTAKAEQALANNIRNYQSKTSGKNGATGTAIKNTLSGTSSMIGMVTGGAVWGEAATNIFGSQGTMLGTLFGSMFVSQATAVLTKGLLNIGSTIGAAKAGTSIVSALTAGVSGGLPGLIIAGVVVVGTAIMAWINHAKKKQEELLKEQAEKFKEESTKYQDMLTGSVNSGRWDELSKGVDKLGRNVSLTDEEYQEFLDLNTELAQLFPSLIGHVDAQGQAFLTTSEGSNTLTDSINKLIDAQQALADQSLLEPELFEDNWNKAAENYRKAKEEYENSLNASKLSFDDGALYRTGTNTSTLGYETSILDLNNPNDIQGVYETLRNNPNLVWGDDWDYLSLENERGITEGHFTFKNEEALEEIKKTIESYYEPVKEYSFNLGAVGGKEAGEAYAQFMGQNFEENLIKDLDLNNTVNLIDPLTVPQEKMKEYNKLLEAIEKQQEKQEAIKKKLEEQGVEIKDNGNGIFTIINEEDVNKAKAIIAEYDKTITIGLNTLESAGEKLYGVDLSGIGEEKLEELEKALKDSKLETYSIDFNNFLTVNETEVDKAKEVLSKFTDSAKLELLSLNTQMANAEEGIKDYLDAFFRELERGNGYKWFSEFDTVGFNALDDELKGLIRSNLINLSKLGDITADEALPHLAETVNNMRKALAEDTDGIIIEFGYELNEDINNVEFKKGRNQLKTFLMGLIEILGLEEDQFGRLMMSFGFSFTGIEGGEDWKNISKWSDDKDYRKMITDEGLGNKLTVDARTNLDRDYSPNELKEIYEYLKDISLVGGKPIDRDTLFDKVFNAKIYTSSTKELLEQYRKIDKTEENFTTNQEKRIKIIKENMTEWAKSLGLVSTDLDYIAEAMERIPEMSAGGLFSDDITASDIEDIYAGYKEVYDYVTGSDFNGKTWDKDILTKIGDNEKLSKDLAPLLTVGDKSAIIAKLKTIMSEADAVYDQFWVTTMGQTKEGYNKLLDINADLVKEIEKSMEIELDNFETLKEAELAITNITNGKIDQIWVLAMNQLKQYYEADLENFTAAQTTKAKVLANALKLNGLNTETINMNIKGSQNLAGLLWTQYEDWVKAGKPKDSVNIDKFNEMSGFNNKTDWTNYYTEQQLGALYNNQKKEHEDIDKWITEANNQSEQIKNDGLNKLKALTSGISFESYNKNSSDGSGADKFKDQLQNAIDLAKAFDELLDKEWENMLKWDASLGFAADGLSEYNETLSKAVNSQEKLALAEDGFLRSDYYDKKKKSLEDIIKAYQNMIDLYKSDTVVKVDKNGNVTYWNPEETDDDGKPVQMTTKEYYDQLNSYQKDLITYTKELRNLDDEEIEDKKNILSLQKDLMDFEDERLGLYKDYNDYFDAQDQAYERQRNALQLQLQAQKEYLATADTQEEILQRTKEIEETQRAIDDLAYEHQEKIIDMLDSLGASVELRIEAQTKLVQQSRTQEEMIENQKTLNELYKEELEIRKNIAEFYQTEAERELKYLSGTALSNSSAYDLKFNVSIENLEKQKKYIEEQMQNAFNTAYKQYLYEQNADGSRKWTDEEAYQKAMESEDYMSGYQEWMDKQEEIAQKMLDRVNARVAEAQRKLDLLDRSKPDEWSKYGDIREFGNQQIAAVENVIAELQEALKDTSQFTDDQIEDLVNQYNEANEKLIQYKKDVLQQEIDYQDNMFGALEWYIGEQKTLLEEMKDEIDDYYDELLPPLEKELKDRQDLVELLELENALKAAQEKQRVYRQGIGWVKYMPKIYYIG